MTQSWPRIFLIGGSAEKSSYIRANLELLQEIFRDCSAQPYLWDLSECSLPLFSPSWRETLQPQEMLLIEEFILQADQADAFVLGSPVYHNSFSGILKNALDTLARQHFYHKPVALVSNGYSDRTACVPCEHLRSVVKELSAIAIPTQMITLPADFISRESQYVMVNASLRERFWQLAQELLYFTRLLRSVGASQTSIY
ncbi:MAG TPA: NAD(P)H-dependent oxidoreductase [Ktedonobacteraceae bacterium]|nr:NAD(P)H-dependent oxidoreductase [Ktedonobacteraceae bacterium]